MMILSLFVGKITQKWRTSQTCGTKLDERDEKIAENKGREIAKEVVESIFRKKKHGNWRKTIKKSKNNLAGKVKKCIFAA